MRELDQLISLLDRQLEMLAEKLSLMRRMGHCVRQGDMVELQELLDQELALEDGGVVLEREIEILRREMAHAYGRPVEELSLSRLVESLPTPQAIALSDRRERLLTLIENLQRESAAVARLVRFAMDFNKELLTALLGGAAEAEVYSADGSRAASASTLATFRQSV
jgi:hypothetical protein